MSGAVSNVTDVTSLRDAVHVAYSAAAANPAAKHPFPVGRAFAESVGYSRDELDGLPASAVEGFAGVSNVSLFAELPAGSIVLDIGCGAGLDTLIARRRVGPAGRVFSVDFSQAMLDRARCAARQAGATNVEFLEADAERIPLPDASIDVALVNGIFNMTALFWLKNPGISSR